MNELLNAVNSWNYSELILSFITEAQKFGSSAYDYFYIIILKYVFFIMDNYIFYFPIAIPLTLIFYYAYKKMTFQDRTAIGFLFALIFHPISIIWYWILAFNAFFEKFIYYKIFWVNYLLDVPRKKRDYVLESRLRESMKAKETTFLD